MLPELVFGARHAHTPWLVVTDTVCDGHRRDGSGLSRGADLDHDVPEPVDVRVDARRDHRGRVVLVDDRRAREPVPGLQRLAVVVAGRHLLERPLDEEPRVGLVPQRVVGGLAARLDLGRDELGHEADPADADVRHLDVRVLEAPRVLALVDVVEVRAELLDPRVVDRPRADVDPELVPLAEVPGLDDPLDDDAVGLDPVRCELLARLRLELLEAGLEARRVERRELLVGRRGVLVDHVGRDEAHRRADPGVGRHDDVRRADLDRDRDGEERPRAALGDEREVARVEALPHRVLLDRLHHRVREDLHRAHRRLLDAHPERLGRPVGEGGTRLLAVERHPAAEERLG